MRKFEYLILILGLGVIPLAGCAERPEVPNEVAETVGEPAPGDPVPFDVEVLVQTIGGVRLEMFTLRNGPLEARISSYGATLISLRVPDRTGAVADVVLGFDDAAGYLRGHPYFGSTVGRYANRIADGRFTLDGERYVLARNNGANHLHGGVEGFDKKVWEPEPGTNPEGPTLRLRYQSEDGEEGYPGTVDASVVYTLTTDGLRIDYEATTDAPTVLSLTNHAYFNLSGPGTGDVLDHQLMIAAESFTPIREGSIPTGELRPVEGTPFDFREPTPIGARIDDDDEQIRLGNGYDHNFVLARTGDALALAARVVDPSSGRVLEVLTTKPGLQFYTGNFLDGSIVGREGVPYTRRSGFCLETQFFPDSPNQPGFPSAVLRPGESYRHTTVYRFSTAD